MSFDAPGADAGGGGSRSFSDLPVLTATPVKAGGSNVVTAIPTKAGGPQNTSVSQVPAGGGVSNVSVRQTEAGGPQTARVEQVAPSGNNVLTPIKVRPSGNNVLRPVEVQPPKVTSTEPDTSINVSIPEPTREAEPASQQPDAPVASLGRQSDPSGQAGRRRNRFFAQRGRTSIQVGKPAGAGLQIRSRRSGVALGR